MEYTLFSSENPPTTVFELIEKRFIDIETDRKV